MVFLAPRRNTEYFAALFVCLVVWSAMDGPVQSELACVCVCGTAACASGDLKQNPYANTLFRIVERSCFCFWYNSIFLFCFVFLTFSRLNRMYFCARTVHQPIPIVFVLMALPSNRMVARCKVNLWGNFVTETNFFLISMLSGSEAFQQKLSMCNRMNHIFSYDFGLICVWSRRLFVWGGRCKRQMRKKNGDG